MNKVKCKDYVIIKFRNYADRHLLRKPNALNDDLIISQMWERAKLYSEFFWNLVYKVTGNDKYYWYTVYKTDTVPCVIQELQTRFGILHLRGEGWATFLIPNQQVELIDWMIKNATVPTKIVKKINLGYWN